MIDLDNAELQNALQIIQFTRRSLFLTGKAGTGKSTFLRYIAANTKKKHIILAPTGIAAINAGGSTLHSMDRFSVLYRRHIFQTTASFMRNAGLPRLRT